MNYTLRNYTKRTFTQQELLDLQGKGVRFSDDDPSFCPEWGFNSDMEDFYAVSEGSMQLFLSLVEGAKKEATEDPADQFPAFVPLTEMQLSVISRTYMQWSNNQEFDEYLKYNQERVHNEIIQVMKQQAAEKAAEEARRKAEEEKDWVIVDMGTTFDYDQRKFAFVQVAPHKFKIFLIQDEQITWNRYFDEEFHYCQKVKISSLFKA